MVEDIGTANVTDVKSPDFLKALTKPFTKVLVQLDKNVLKAWAQNSPDYENATSVLKPGCRPHEAGDPSCKYLFAHLGPEGVNIGETYIGIIFLAISLCMLGSYLIGMVNTLNSLSGTKGLGWFTKYLAMMASVLMIALVRSPSVIDPHTVQAQHSKFYSALHCESRTSVAQCISPVLLDHMLQDDNSSLNKVCISRQIMSDFIIFHVSYKKSPTTLIQISSTESQEQIRKCFQQLFARATGGQNEDSFQWMSTCYSIVLPNNMSYLYPPLLDGFLLGSLSSTLP